MNTAHLQNQNKRFLNNGIAGFQCHAFKIDQNKKSKTFNRFTPESGNRKKVDMQRHSLRFRSQQFFLWKI